MRVRGLVALTLAALLIVAGLGFFVLTGGESSRTARPDSEAAAPGIAKPSDPSLPPGSESLAAHGELVAVPDSASSAAASDWLDLHVVHRVGRVPVARAEVLWWPYPEVASEEQGPEPSKWFVAGELEQRAAEGSRRFYADDSGVARIPPSQRTVLLIGSADGWWGFRVLRPDAEPPRELELARDADLRIQVVDGSGRALSGVPVALRHRFRGGYSHDLMTALTREPDGIAVLEHASFGAPYELQGDLSAAIRALVEPAAEVAVHLDALSDEPVRLVLEPTGACDVEVVDWNGKPYTGPVEIGLRFRTQAEETEPVHVRLGRRWSGERRGPVDGPLVAFDHVEPGRELVASVIRQGASLAHEGSGPGPRSAGERARITVKLGSGVAVLSGRLIGLDGSPLASRDFRAQLEADPGAVVDENWGARTDADGRFHVDVSPSKDAERRAWLVVSITDERGAELASARKPIDGALEPGVRDVGDLELVESPLLASGRVIDGEGRAVAKAQVVPSIQRFYGSGEDEFWWEPLGQNMVTTGADGEFRIRSAVKVESLSLTAQKGSLKADPVRVASGASGVVIALGPTGSIAGSVLLDPSFETSRFQISAQLVDPGRDPEAGESWFGDTLARDGSFKVRGLPPGVYRVGVVEGYSGWREIAAVDDVVVAAGEPKRDPRLDPLDLRGKLRSIRLDLVDESGASVSSGQVTFAEQGGSGQRGAQIESGSLVLVSRGAPLDVRIQSFGFLSVDLKGVTESQRVTLRRGPKLRFVLARGVRLPAPPITLDVALEPIDPARAGAWDLGFAAFDEHGEARMPATILGRVRLRFAVTQRTPTSTSTTYFDHQLREIEVVDGSTEQVFEVTVDQARLDEAVRSFEQR